MALEIFVVSVVFWIAVLIIFVLLDRRLARLEEKVANLEKMQKRE